MNNSIGNMKKIIFVIYLSFGVISAPVFSSDYHSLGKMKCKDITEALKGAEIHRFNREGTHDSGWVLLDFSDVIVHIFGPEEREFFGLERLWSGASEVVRIL